MAGKKCQNDIAQRKLGQKVLQMSKQAALEAVKGNNVVQLQINDAFYALKRRNMQRRTLSFDCANCK